MKEVIVKEEIALKPQQVFSLITDISKFADMIEGIDKAEVLTGGSIGKGTRWRETRTFMGQVATEEMEITGIQEPHGYQIEARSHGTLYQSSYALKDLGDKTEITMSFQAKPESLFAKVMGFIMAPFMQGSIAEHLAKDLKDLKHYAENKRAA